MTDDQVVAFFLLRKIEDCQSTLYSPFGTEGSFMLKRSCWSIDSLREENLESGNVGQKSRFIKIGSKVINKDITSLAFIDVKVIKHRVGGI